MTERGKALTNLIVTAILTINAALTLAGKNPIPFDESAFTAVASQIIAGAAIVWSWWKNNNLTEDAIDAQGYLDDLKDDYGVEYDDDAEEDYDAPLEITEEEVMKHVEEEA